MSDDKENIEQEKVNKQSWWKKLLGLKPTYKLIILIVFFGSLLLTKIDFENENKYLNVAIAQSTIAEFKQNNKVENKLNMKENKNYNIKKYNIRNMKISTPMQCKEKGLHYIGEMTSPRIFHKTIKMNDGKIFIIGGKKEILISDQNSHIKGHINKFLKYDYINNETAEIFDPSNNSFTKTISNPLQENYINIIPLDNGNILLVSNEFEVFNIKEKQFKKVGKRKNINNISSEIDNSKFSEKDTDNSLFECTWNINGNIIQNTCWHTSLEKYDVNSIQSFNLRIPESIDAINFGYLQVDEDKILIYSESFPEKSKNIFIAIYDKKNNKILSTKKLIDINNSNGFIFPIPIDKNKILLANDVLYRQGINTSLHNQEDSFLKWFVFNTSENKLEKKINMLYPDSALLGSPIKLQNNNLLVFEGNKIRQVLNMKTLELEEFDGFIIEDLLNMNIIQINENQILISGGIEAKKQNIKSVAFIYTF